jgi:hypothetical protein
VTGLHATGRSPNLIFMTMDFCRERRRDAAGCTQSWNGGRDSGRVIDEVQIAAPLVS